jgi:hypothetical protein
MSGYAKLFSSIIHSTIWREPDHRRILWVTLLALKDQHGIVEASVPGLADAARISLENVLDGLQAFQQPDTWSRNQSDEGRRIREVQGGWLVLNHQHYRDLMSLEERRARDAERKRLARATKNVLGQSADAGQFREVSHTDPDPDQIQKQMQRESAENPPEGAPAARAAASKVSTLDVSRVWNHYVGALKKPKHKLDAKRKKIIARALAAYSVEDLYEAINGCAKSDFHMGREPGKPTRHDGIELILRDGAHIDRFREVAANPPAPSFGRDKPALPGRPAAEVLRAHGLDK